MPAAARVELLCIGSELLAGHVNTHQAYFCQALRAAGFEVLRESSLPDDAQAIASEIRRCLQRCDALLLSGGLGPTFDDLSREAVSSALGRKMFYRPGLYAGIRKKFSRYKLPTPRENRRQAFVVQGAEVVDNPMGSAPGQIITLPRAGRPQTVALMPGPFSELSVMFEKTVLPRLRKTYACDTHSASLTLHLYGIPEASADAALKPLTSSGGSELRFTILAGPGQVDFHAQSFAGSAARAKALIASVRRSAYKKVGAYIFGEGSQSVESLLGEALLRRSLSLSVAESCTAGLAGARLTATPGSSAYFKGGVLCYSNDVKSGVLGVSHKTLRRHGAVSAACAAEMAAGSRRLTRSDVALSITGIAGPGGAAPGKPVGLVWIAIDGPGKRRGYWRQIISGDRAMIRSRAVTAALHRLLRHLREDRS